MIGFFIVSVVFLCIAEMVTGILWYSVFFKKQFVELTKMDMDQADQKEMRGTFMNQLLLALVRAVWATLIILFLPRGFFALVVVVLYVFVFPLIQYGDNLWLKKKSMALVWLDSAYLMALYGITFAISLFLKIWLVY